LSIFAPYTYEGEVVRLLGFIIICIFGVAGLAAAPNIAGVYNAASWVVPHQTNSAIAEGSIFTVTGTGLGPATIQHANSYPLPTTEGLGGTTIQVTVNGVAKSCVMLYSLVTQVAGILPSATPAGTGTLTLSYQGEQSSIAIQVLAANFGTFALNENGTGPGVFTDGSNNPITYIHPAHPGQELVLWGTGLGPITTDDADPPAQVDLHSGVQVVVNNQPAAVVYGGRGSSAGVDQINFVIPAGITGCKASVAVMVKGVTGNITSIAVAPEGQATCGDPVGPLTAANMEKAAATGSLSLGGVVVSRLNGENDALGAAFATYSLSNLVKSWGGGTTGSIGSCLSYEVLGSTLNPIDPVAAQFLNSGNQLKLTSNGGSKTISELETGLYAATLATEPDQYIEPGPFSVSNGTGGPGVGAFTWSLTLPDAVVPTNIPASISLSRDLTLTWTGGSGFSAVSIFLFSGVPVAGLGTAYVEIQCAADAASGSFTIPSAVLNLLSPSGFGAFEKPGVDIQIAGAVLKPFTDVPGSPGLDMGIFTAFVSNGGVARIE
jgi:uncharacterized protein (TIGR03437 family)